VLVSGTLYNHPLITFEDKQPL